MTTETIMTEATTEIENDPFTLPLTDFVRDFGDGLLAAVDRQNPPVYDGQPDLQRNAVMDQLSRQPFPAQREVVQAMAKLLIDADYPAGVINGEMGCGKTMVSICLARVLYEQGYHRSLVLSPPHLVYKWRREILDTIPNARVVVLNGSDTLKKLMQLRSRMRQPQSNPVPEFYILGRVRMRLGFHWKPAFLVKKSHERILLNHQEANAASFVTTRHYAACPSCGSVVMTEEGDPLKAISFPTERRLHCQQCHEPLWTLTHPGKQALSRRQLLSKSVCQLPTLGPKTANRLLDHFGEDLIGGMLEDNVYEFINLMDDHGDLVFSDRQAQRMERSMARMEFNFGQGGYQPTEFIKRFLPKAFDLLLIDEGHEYKNENSAQGQAMGVLADHVRKVVLLTGTLMGGYASDLFHLLWRIMPRQMIEDGYRYNARNSLGTAAMGFMREHGVLKDVYKEMEADAHKTARSKRYSVRTSKAPGFGPKGVARYVLPFTAFLKLKDIGGKVLPPYNEYFQEVAMTDEQESHYADLQQRLTDFLKAALRSGDTSLLGVVLNVLLAWPDCCFREELVKHPRTRQVLALVPPVLDDDPSPKEEELIEICRREKANNRKVLVYSVYTGKRDTTARLKQLLEAEHFKVAVLKASVSTDRREEWIMDQADRGIDVLITNPELVKTGLDLLEFPTLVFLQSGYNVYTLQQASRRSWRIGQKEPVSVYFLGYGKTAQMTCLSLMAKKIAVSQSTSGDMPETGLDILNQDGDSVEVALARQLLS